MIFRWFDFRRQAILVDSFTDFRYSISVFLNVDFRRQSVFVESSSIFVDIRSSSIFVDVRFSPIFIDFHRRSTFVQLSIFVRIRYFVFCRRISVDFRLRSTSWQDLLDFRRRTTFADFSYTLVNVRLSLIFRRFPSTFDVRWFFVRCRRLWISFCLFVDFRRRSIFIFLLLSFVGIWLFFFLCRFSPSFEIHRFFVDFLSAIDFRPFLLDARRRSIFVDCSSICVENRRSLILRRLWSSSMFRWFSSSFDFR